MYVYTDSQDDTVHGLYYDVYDAGARSPTIVILSVSIILEQM